MHQAHIDSIYVYVYCLHIQGVYTYTMSTHTHTVYTHHLPHGEYSKRLLTHCRDADDKRLIYSA